MKSSEKTRTFGWIQNPNNFNTLKDIVSIFDSSTKHYARLREELVPQLIPFDNLRNQFLQELNHDQTTFTYSELVGSSKGLDGKQAKTRKDAVADSLIQISIEPQQKNTSGKSWTDNWTADGYLRWALTLDFVSFDRSTDTCKITPLGEQLINTSNDRELADVMTEAILSYPPATRVLDILESNQNFSMTKFAIGEKLGFKGEPGFTSYSESLMLEWLESEENEANRKKIRSDIEGTADKYARGICSWLAKLKLVAAHTNSKLIDGKRITLFPTYTITGKGISSLRRSKGFSKNEKTIKYVPWELLATKVSGVNYVRSRRAKLLKLLQTHSSKKIIISSLVEQGFSDAPDAINSDISGLNNIGIRILIQDDRYILQDSIKMNEIPTIVLNEKQQVTEIQQLKYELQRTTNLPAKYYELVDIAFDPKRNRDYEMMTADLLINICGFKGTHLGGPNRPDIVIYTQDYGIIVDTKAYSKGYSKNIQQSDEMIRYIDDNQTRDPEINRSRWWKAFDSNVEKFYFLWVSTYFTGDFESQLREVSMRKNIKGGAIGVEALLRFASKVYNHQVTLSDFEKELDQKIIDYSE